MDRQPLVRIPATSAGPAAHAGEGGRGPETARPAAAAADPAGPLPGVRDDQEAPTEGDQQPADNRWVATALEGADAITPEGAEPAEPFELGTAGQRPHHLNEGGLEKAATTVGTGREKEAAGTGRAGIFDQIVQRAIVQVKTDQSEVKIDLKPDFLGHVRMQIVSENQQVSVRILTELPVVRDMIEAGLQQLRAELQNQGLHVDRLEVAVSDDPRQPPRRQARADELPKAGGSGAAPDADGTVSSGRVEPVYYQRRTGGAATIDMFV
jgi:flagellar hook-length control protein FliK